MADTRSQNCSIDASPGARIALAAFLALSSLGTAAAAADFPKNEVHLVVNYGPGGSTDVAARVLAKGMEARLGRPVVVENKPGALGTLGPSYVARQTPDGYTVGVVTYSTQAILPHLMKLPYADQDFAFVAGVGRYRYGIVVRADSPYLTLQDLLNNAKKGDGVFLGSPSAAVNLAVLELSRQTGGKFEQVLYKSGTETVNALLGKQIDVTVANPSDVLPHMQAGKLRMIASVGTMRWPEYPDIPTLRESGWPVQIDASIGLAAPLGTPPEVLAILQDAVIGAVRDAATLESFDKLGMDAMPLNGAEYAAQLKKGLQEMGQMIRDTQMPRVN